jgi:phosphate transport system substrate-binding protein
VDNQASPENKPGPTGNPGGTGATPSTPSDHATSDGGRISAVRIGIILVLGAVLCLAVYFSPHFLIKEEKQPTFTQLKTGGTSVGNTLVANLWRDAYRKEKGIDVNYESTGSTAGVTNMINGTYAIAVTHAPLSPEQINTAKSNGGEVVHVPILICGVAPIYNLPTLADKPPLNFTGEVLADIFLGKIDHWDHPDLKKLNPGVDLPHMKITVVHRGDSSGTTQLFTDYLVNSSAAWKSKFEKPTSEIKEWPVGVPVNRNLGVAFRVHETEGSIGYVDLFFTTYEDFVLQYGAVQNKDKTKFVRADPENLTAALRAAYPEIPEDLAFGLANKSGADSYPICGVIYAVCYQNQPEVNRQHVIDFLEWAIHEGQKYSAKIHSAALPPDLATRAEARIKSIKGK